MRALANVKLPVTFLIIFSARIRSTAGGYVFIGGPVQGDTPGSGPRSFWEGVPPSPITSPVQSPVPGLAGGTPARTGRGTPRTGQPFLDTRASDATQRFDICSG